MSHHPGPRALFPHLVPPTERMKRCLQLPDMEANITQPHISPPASTLPQLPASRSETPLTASESSQQQSPPPTAPRLALKTPSKIVKPSTSPSTSHPVSSPIIPTLRSNSARQAQNQAEGSSTDKEIRRSVSIANFPHPPKVKRTGLDSKYSTASHSLITEATAQSKDGNDTRTGSLRIKRLKTKASTDGLSQIHSGGSILSLLNGSGDSKSISSFPKIRMSNDFANLRSPPHSRSSSAQGSCSTSATTFEDTDEKKTKEEYVSTSDGSKRRASGRRQHEGKGNVTVSVRVRPDAGAEKSSGKDWMVDSRQSLVAYRGREGGDYYYGKSVAFRCTTSNTTSSASALWASQMPPPASELRSFVILHLKTICVVIC